MRRALALALLLVACKKESQHARVVAEPSPAPARAPFPKDRLSQPPAFAKFGLLLTGGDTVDKALRACPMKEFRQVAFDAPVPKDAGTVRWKRASLADLPLPDAETIEDLAVELTAAEKAGAARASGWLMVAFIAPSDLVPHSASAVECLARNARALIVDHLTAQIFSPASWKRTHLDTTHEGLPEGARHVVVVHDGDGGLLRLATAGMAKFALPEVVVERVARSDGDTMTALINLVCQTLIEHRALDDNGRLTVEIASLRHAPMRKLYQEDLVGKPEGRATLQVVVGEPPADDPESTLLEIAFPGSGAVQERHDALLAKIFGKHEDKLVHVKHDARVLAASTAAKKQLAKLQPRFKKGLATKERLLVKAPFRTSSDGNEWMWVEVTAWNGDQIRGILQNDPVDVPGLKSGATVEASQASLFDYIFYNADGTTEGNTTGKLLQEGR